MRCHICDAGLSEVHYNRDANEFEPCGTCLEVVKDTLEGFIDKPMADESELGDDRVLAGYAASASSRLNAYWAAAYELYPDKDD